MKNLPIVIAAFFCLQTSAAYAEDIHPTFPAAANDFSGSLGDKELSTYRGGKADPIFNTVASDLSATMTNNTVSNISSGGNYIGAGALDFNGLGSVVLNTGSGNVIQNSLTVNVTINP